MERNPPAGHRWQQAVRERGVTVITAPGRKSQRQLLREPGLQVRLACPPAPEGRKGGLAAGQTRESAHVSTSDQFNQCHAAGGKVCSQGHRCVWPSLQVAGAAAVAGLGQVAGRQQRGREAESGSPRRSEVTALGLHVARLPGLAAGQLGEAGGHPGLAALAQRLSGWGGVSVREGRADEWAPNAGTGLRSGAHGQLLPAGW